MTLMMPRWELQPHLGGMVDRSVTSRGPCRRRNPGAFSIARASNERDNSVNPSAALSITLQNEGAVRTKAAAISPLLQNYESLGG